MNADLLLKFVDILNKPELNSAFVQKRTQRDRTRERERVISSRRYKDVRRRLGKADAGALSCHISISEGIVEESARKQKGWISTD